MLFLKYLSISRDFFLFYSSDSSDEDDDSEEDTNLAPPKLAPVSKGMCHKNFFEKFHEIDDVHFFLQFLMVKLLINGFLA